ncbi:MAG: hypothetical protein DHS20C14_10170 [Phycisphaeraceae bacterium]|nr:MAG: hypothetical protein DHS20C14_10170 [Phycisphaeraceae bacterium]
MILAIVGGSAVVIAGPDRLHALVHQTRTGINDVIDSAIDDPIALRTQIKKLEAEYPARIADVRSDLTEVDAQIAELEREAKVAQRVVALASDDLAQLDAVIAQGRDAQAEHPGAIVRISFNRKKVDLSDAYAKRSQVEQTRTLYATRAADLGVDLTYLVEQEDQLADLLTKLESERAEFQSKLFQLDAQIDTIERNERMLSMMEDRQKTIDRHNRYQAHSLDQLNNRLTGIRSEQRSRLESIAGRERDKDYVSQAEFELDTGLEGQGYNPATEDAGYLIQPRIIDVEPTDSADQGSVASTR